jgi:hypothetical protein
MDSNQMQQEIALIKRMIEKTRAEAGDSGWLFTIIGIGSILYVAVVVAVQELFNHLLVPAMIVITAVFGLTIFVLGRRREKKEKVRSYPKAVADAVTATCGIACLLTTILFPMTRVYPLYLGPVFAMLLFGVIQITISVVYATRYLFWAGLISWAGACVLAYTKPVRTNWPIATATMIVVLFTGFVVPGILLNRKHRLKVRQSGS